MMNAMTIADLSLSQDLDREALAAHIGGTGVCAITLDHLEYYTTSWSNYYDPKLVANFYNSYGQRYKSQVRWTRQRTQYEYSYWNYYYC
jgi:hypothetical protein